MNDNELDLSYFELQAYVGTTKHLGGFATTQRLVELCKIDGDDLVLEVGCGVGATACYLAQTYGCRVMGVDLRQSMVERSRERAEREGVTDLVEFKVADAIDLPFDDHRFDVLFCESVLTFVAAKQAALDEFVRVVRPDGRVGLNEQFWMQPPTEEMVQFARHMWDIAAELPGLNRWTEMLQRAGLRDVIVERYTYHARREATQIKRYALIDMVRMFVRTLRLYVTNPDFRAYMANRYKPPKDFFDYLGYALFVSQSPDSTD